MLNHLLLASAEKGFNRLLQTDPPSLKHLARLAGQVIAVQCRQPSVRLYIIPHTQGLQLAQHWEAPVSCLLSASSGQLLSLLFSQEKTSILHQPGVTIDGDSALLMSFTELLETMQLDWEFLLSQWLGSVPTALFSTHLRNQTQWLKQGCNNLHHEVTDYLTKETRLLVSHQEAQAAFFTQLDQLKLQLDRLETRVRLLNQRSSPTP